MELVREAVESGANLSESCSCLGITVRSYERWQLNLHEDMRHGPLTSPRNKLTAEERQLVIDTANSDKYCDLSPSVIVPMLADEGKYIASESSFYRILNEEKLLKHRARAKPATHRKPDEHTATAPNQVWSWDISYLKSLIKGSFFYAYLIEDVYSRKIVAGDVYESESSDYAASLMRQACLSEGIVENQITLHSDNGSPMKGATMLSTLQSLGVMPSFSRPSVSNDNPFSEALFKTMKYVPEYPSNPFESLEDARRWLKWFINWYNNEHLHSEIKFVTPADRHCRKDSLILKKRKVVYNKARKKNPARWTGNIRNWDKIEVVRLNPLKNDEEVCMKEAA